MHWHFDEFIWVVLDSNFSHKIKNQPFNFFSVFIENSSAEAIYEQLHRSICLDHPICSQKLPRWVKGWEKYSSLWAEIDMFCELGFYFRIHVILFQGKSGFLAKRTGVSFGYLLGILYENGCRLQEKACFLRRVSYTAWSDAPVVQWIGHSPAKTGIPVRLRAGALWNVSFHHNGVYYLGW